MIQETAHLVKSKHILHDFLSQTKQADTKHKGQICKPSKIIRQGIMMNNKFHMKEK